MLRNDSQKKSIDNRRDKGFFVKLKNSTYLKNCILAMSLLFDAVSLSVSAAINTKEMLVYKQIFFEKFNFKLSYAGNNRCIFTRFVDLYQYGHAHVDVLECNSSQLN